LLVVLGHVTFIIALNEAIDITRYQLLFIELLLSFLSLRFYNIKHYHFLQTTLTLLILFAIATKDLYDSDWILLFWSLSLLLLIYLHLYPKPLLLTVRNALISVQSLYILLLFLNQGFYYSMKFNAMHYTHVLQMHSFITTLVLAAFTLIAYRSLRTHWLTLLLLIVALYFSWFHYQSLTLPLLFLALSFYSGETFLRYMSLVLLVIYLTFYYYMLHIPLDEKALILMLTGLIILALTWLIKRSRITQ
jgi:hypothetical protein